ncbi:MAG TPA: alpha-2-macroglobulin family protein [Pyrinomonadaceae bacterium]|nr:alpha-2-macroglobulin family protein [Pyrinomonadaceae bacterium]
MKTIILSVAAFAFLLFNVVAQQSDYSQLRSDAETQYAQGSYARANELYSKIDKSKLSATEARWVEFRLADTLWRSQAATETSDTTKLEQAQKQLEELIRVADKETDRDLVWAEAHESLGDLSWRRGQMNWSTAWPHYQQALDWWAGQRDIERARDRYLKIVFKAAHPPNAEEYYFYTYYGYYIPLDVLENALKISTSANEKSHLNFLLAMSMRFAGGDAYARYRVPDQFEDALKAGKQSGWYDDALFYYAEWMNNAGTVRQLANGQWQEQPDYEKALELYHRLLREFTKGETRYYDQAQQQIKSITEPVVSVGVANIFLPGSEIQFYLNARNVNRVAFNLYKFDMVRDVRFIPSEDAEEGDSDSTPWLQKIPTAGRTAVKSWSKELSDSASHKIFSEQVRLEGKLPVGAYLLEAKSGSRSAREMILVSDATLVLKSTPTQGLVFFANALTGAPIANANVALWESYYEDSKWRSRRLRQTTDADGLARFALRNTQQSHNLFATAAISDRQAFVSGSSYSYNRTDGWRIYAFTDRPAYRPKETMQWKIIARQTKDGAYTTPANEIVYYEIDDPRGTKVAEGKSTLNQFGSAWGSLDLGDQFPLGEYTIQFWSTASRNEFIGNAKLFRLEEYKLPEFKVQVKTPEEAGRKKAFRLGEKVEVEIQADYYFGGPVSNAAVEAVVYQVPFYHYWTPRHDYSWYYDEFQRQNYGAASVVAREQIKTDATGKAKLTFDTPRENYNQDYEYRVEARVVDSSRREIVASDRVRVTRDRYYVYPQPERNIYRPKDRVTIDIKAQDANEQPVQTEGTVTVTRDYWWEIWIDPRGREVQGDELRQLKERYGVFPPQVTARDQRPWQIKFRGYQHENVLTQSVKTDSNGEAQFNFTPERDGYYRIAWQSSQIVDPKRDRFLGPIYAETNVFVASNATTDLGYRTSGLEIIIDKDTVRAGQTAPVMLSVPVSDRYVLFSVEGEDLFSYKVVHIEGNAKLIELPIEEKYVPNIYLNALMITDASWFSNTKQVVVPPVERFLSVAVKADREQYQPREEGTLAISAKDVNGRPVAAEIALGLVDESVQYIQQDYAGDPRQFYYGQKRGLLVQTQATISQKGYARLVEDAAGQLADRKDSNEKEMDLTTAVARRGEAQASFNSGISGVGGAITELSINARDVNSLVMLSPGAVAEYGKNQKAAAAPEQEPAVQVRSDFRSTILWLPDVKTDADGTATVKVKYPDSLTTWTATARVATAGNQFGIGNSSTRTKQPLIVRLQAPRFFVVGDQVTVSGVINNNTDEAMSVVPALTAEGLTVTGLLIDGKPVNGAQPPVEVKANSETRVDWLVAVTHASEAKLKVEARGDKYADAMEKTFTIFEHGIEKFISRSGKMRGDSVSIKLDIPKERRADSTKLTVQIAPSMATTMLDALPYLIDYPYGCTEQTMSRFLPAVITAKTLHDLGLKPETAMHKIFGGIEEATATATHPKGSKDLKELEKITQQGLERLYDFQHADGGWGWWKQGESDHFMTAYVLWGMSLGRQAGIDVKSDVMERAAAFLDKELVEEETNYDEQSWILHSLAVYHATLKQSEVGKFQQTAFTNLWNNRDKLNAYTRALLALAAHNYGYHEQAKTLIANLENGVKIDSTPDTSIVQRGAQSSDPSVIGTAHWGEDGVYWRWSDGGVEATSFALRALLAIDPKNKLVEPVTNWLVKNRRGAQWSNTRDTAIVVLTLNDYLKVSGEVQPALSYQLVVNGTPVATKELTADDALSAPSTFAVSRELLRDGQNEISIVRKSGSGPIYFAAAAEFFSLEEPLKPAGNEIFVRRQYFKLVNHPTLLKGFVSERVPLNDGETVKSGDRVEVVLTVEAKNNYEYLLFEDLKPAGLEAVQLRSGESLYVRQLKADGGFTGRQRWVYQELRDRKVALFIDQLPEGVWQLSYEMRAEAPGAFHALPVLGQAMYVPEIRTNGAETRVRVVD